ncbi:hypothetical protein [Streptomyces fradiae]|uniref:hypothetical protein n=1 Tax=Streptomyces fradiae TaxID=1906 RepID=UPI002941DCD5|nr:hypothetical protein [Streptomyces fradiae]WOI58598.1 hypothetical protein RYQ63_00860 [Streptomyces fradiae]
MVYAGQIITANMWNRLQPVDYFAQATNLLTRTDATFADIPGATVTFTTTAANASYKVIGVFDCAVGAVGASTRMLGRIVTDGVAESGFAIHEMDDTDRDTVTTTAKGTLASAGSHTIKLQGALSGALATGGTFQVFSQILVTVTEVP